MSASRWKQVLRRAIVVLLAAIVGFFLVISALLLAFQHQLIYFPRPYEDVVLRHLSPDVVRIDYSTSEGSQTAFYRQPSDEPDAPADRLWVCFHGNGSQALDWEDFFARFPDGRAGFLFIDYPGYGACEGSASPAAIRESAEGAVAALAAQLGVPEARLEEHMGTVGFSLGAATSLEFAARRPVERVVLLSPFTSMLDMARLTVPFPLYHLLLHRFDNEARLAELLARPAPPRISIFHSDSDDVIPVSMGRALSRLSPEQIEYTELRGFDHNSTAYAARMKVLDAMTAPGE